MRETEITLQVFQQYRFVCQSLLIPVDFGEIDFKSVRGGRNYQLWRHATDTFAILVVCAQNAIWDERTLPSGLICRSSMQKYAFPRQVVVKAYFLFDYRDCVYLHDMPRALLLLI